MNSFPRSAAVLWFTGLPGSGKSTIARGVYHEVRALTLPAELLDGDEIRTLYPAGFSRTERINHLKRVGYMASRLEHHGVTVLCALIAPYAEARDHVRRLCRNYIEIYVSTPLEECERRDPKGLYAGARRGDVLSFTGVDDAYEPPATPELSIDTTRMTVSEAVERVVAHWRKVVGH